VSLPDTLLVNGTDIQSIDGLTLEDASALHLDGPYRGENLVMPGRPGQVSYEKVRDAYVMDFPVVLAGDSRQDFLDVLDAVRALCPTNLCELTRRLTDGGGSVDDYCDGEYLANQSVALLNAQTGRTVLSFVNLFGEWSVTS
jgi:hypothetical protein